MYLKHNKGTPGNETVLVKVYFKRESNEFSAKIRMWVHSKIHCPPGYVGLAPKRREKLPVLMSRTNAEIIFEQLYSNDDIIECDMFQHCKFAFATAPLQSTNACPPPPIHTPCFLLPDKGGTICDLKKYTNRSGRQQNFLTNTKNGCGTDRRCGCKGKIHHCCPQNAWPLAHLLSKRGRGICAPAVLVCFPEGCSSPQG